LLLLFLLFDAVRKVLLVARLDDVFLYRENAAAFFAEFEQK
jgi:hypothetical protein